MRLLRAIAIGGSAPKPPGFIAFFPPEWQVSVGEFEGDIAAALLPIPAAEPVARVASQHCPIPSGSGTLSMHQGNPLFNTKKADRLRDQREF